MKLALLHEIGHAYQHGIVHAGKQPELLLLVSFLCTFAFIRTSAHMIRSDRFQWWPGNVSMGGTHVHHLVWGIILLLVVGYCGLAFEPPTPIREILAILFGIGAGLTLDEFALWLNLEDVYWTEKGRRSIDAVIVATLGAALVLFGVRIWLDVARDVEHLVEFMVGSFWLIGALLGVLNLLKGKYAMAVIGFFFPPVGLVGVLRLARPQSIWARGYSEQRMARSRERFGDDIDRRRKPAAAPATESEGAADAPAAERAGSTS